MKEECVRQDTVYVLTKSEGYNRIIEDKMYKIKISNG